MPGLAGDARERDDGGAVGVLDRGGDRHDDVAAGFVVVGDDHRLELRELQRGNVRAFGNCVAMVIATSFPKNSATGALLTNSAISAISAVLVSFWGATLTAKSAAAARP